MLPISELNLGFNDAENYRRREEKDWFNQIFIRTRYIDELCQRNIFFLIGEKGMGKTAHAVYMSNEPYYQAKSDEMPFHSRLAFLSETEYEKFVQMKKNHHLQLSDYKDIWTVILYLLIAKQISSEEKQNKSPVTNWLRFRHLENAIDEYYEDAFSPEIISAINFVEDAEVSAGIVAEHLSGLNLGGKRRRSRSFTENRFQMHLAYLQRNFEQAFKDLKLEKNHILFIDGIDIRPSPIKYEDYLECVKGLANAVWRVNNDFFPSIRDSKGRLRVVLLMRPDIFDSLGLQNQNNKIRDNAVVLNWLTAYSEYRSSELFAIVDRLLAVQQDNDLELGEAWDHYFPFSIPRRSYKARQGVVADDDSPFIEFIRISFHRPRDIISALDYLKRYVIEVYGPQKTVFTERDINNPSFRRDYAQYLVGEIKDQLSFYHTPNEYKIFRQFFTYLNGNIEFDYDEYVTAFNKMKDTLSKDKDTIPVFFETKEKFLQFLYELNVLCYIQYTERDEPHFHWCFRDRTPTNLSPRVKTDVSYRIHYGIAKALDIGQRFNKKRR